MTLLARLPTGRTIALRMHSPWERATVGELRALLHFKLDKPANLQFSHSGGQPLDDDSSLLRSHQIRPLATIDVLASGGLLGGSEDPVPKKKIRVIEKVSDEDRDSLEYIDYEFGGEKIILKDN